MESYSRNGGPTVVLEIGQLYKGRRNLEQAFRRGFLVALSPGRWECPYQHAGSRHAWDAGFRACRRQLQKAAKAAKETAA